MSRKFSQKAIDHLARDTILFVQRPWRRKRNLVPRGHPFDDHFHGRQFSRCQAFDFRGFVVEALQLLFAEAAPYSVLFVKADNKGGDRIGYNTFFQKYIDAVYGRGLSVHEVLNAQSYCLQRLIAIIYSPDPGPQVSGSCQEQCHHKKRIILAEMAASKLNTGWHKT